MLLCVALMLHKGQSRSVPPLVLVKPRCLSQVESPQGVHQTQISLDGGTSNSMSSLALQQWLVSLYEKYSF